jgi:hypothetical protein
VTTWIALLRGINLGPRNKIAMADLRELLTELGHGDVRTQSWPATDRRRERRGVETLKRQRRGLIRR